MLALSTADPDLIPGNTWSLGKHISLGKAGLTLGTVGTGHIINSGSLIALPV